MDSNELVRSYVYETSLGTKDALGRTVTNERPLIPGCMRPTARLLPEERAKAERLYSQFLSDLRRDEVSGGMIIDAVEKVRLGTSMIEDETLASRALERPFGLSANGSLGSSNRL